MASAIIKDKRWQVLLLGAGDMLYIGNEAAA